MAKFRVVDLRTDPPTEFEVEGSAPEKAASDILKMDLVRSGSPKRVAAKVYWPDGAEGTNMVRLYQRIDGPSSA